VRVTQFAHKAAITVCAMRLEKANKTTLKAQQNVILTGKIVVFIVNQHFLS